MSLAKQVHVGLLVFGTPGWNLIHMQVHKLIIALLRNVTSYTVLFQCIVMIILPYFHRRRHCLQNPSSFYSISLINPT